MGKLMAHATSVTKSCLCPFAMPQHIWVFLSRIQAHWEHYINTALMTKTVGRFTAVHVHVIILFNVAEGYQWYRSRTSGLCPLLRCVSEPSCSCSFSCWLNKRGRVLPGMNPRRRSCETFHVTRGTCMCTCLCLFPPAFCRVCFPPDIIVSMSVQVFQALKNPFTLEDFLSLLHLSFHDRTNM